MFISHGPQSLQDSMGMSERTKFLLGKKLFSLALSDVKLFKNKKEVYPHKILGNALTLTKFSERFFAEHQVRIGAGN